MCIQGLKIFSTYTVFALNANLSSEIIVCYILASKNAPLMPYNMVSDFINLIQERLKIMNNDVCSHIRVR